MKAYSKFLQTILILFIVFVLPNNSIAESKGESISIPSLGLEIAYEKVTFNHPQYGTQNLEGSRVVSIQPNSPITKTGLKKGDLITGLGRFYPKNPDELVRFLSANFKKGDEIKITTMKPDSRGKLITNTVEFEISEKFQMATHSFAKPTNRINKKSFRGNSAQKYISKQNPKKHRTEEEKDTRKEKARYYGATDLFRYRDWQTRIMTDDPSLSRDPKKRLQQLTDKLYSFERAHWKCFVMDKIIAYPNNNKVYNINGFSNQLLLIYSPEGNIDLSYRVYTRPSAYIRNLRKEFSYPIFVTKRNAFISFDYSPKTSHESSKPIPIYILVFGNTFGDYGPGCNFKKMSRSAAKHLEKQEPSAKSSYTQDLAEFGYKNATHLIDKDKTKFYYVQLHNNYFQSLEFVALHDVGPNEPLLDLEESEDGRVFLTYEERGLREFYEETLIPLIEKRWPKVRQVRIRHFAKGLKSPHGLPVNVSRITRETISSDSYRWNMSVNWKRNTIEDSKRHDRDLALEKDRAKKSKVARREKKKEEQKMAADHQRAQAEKKGLKAAGELDWESYSGNLVKNVFLGQFEKIKSQANYAYKFHILYSSYVEKYYDECRPHLTKDAVRINFTKSTTTRNGYGTVLNKTTQKNGYIYVEPRFAKKYEAYFNGPVGFGIVLDTLGKGKLIPDMTYIMDMNLFMKVEPCNGLTMNQMGENLLRFAYLQNSLQQEPDGKFSVIPELNNSKIDKTREIRRKTLIQEVRKKTGEVNRLKDSCTLSYPEPVCDCMVPYISPRANANLKEKFNKDFNKGLEEFWKNYDHRPYIERCAKS